MVDKVRESLKRIDHRLFIALLFMGLCPTVYTTLRTFFLGTFPGEWSYSIAGQLSWINLIYEVINEAIILPLYFFMGSALTDKKAFANRIRSGLLVSFGVYAVCSVLVATFINPLLQFMAVSTDIIEESAAYIRIECVANVFGILYSFLLVALVSIGKDKLVYIMTGAKLVMCIILDTMLVSNLPLSLKLGVNGIGISNCISNLLLFIIAFALIQGCGYSLLSGEKLSFDWMKDFFKIGGISGLESFVRNVAYMLMVSRMVNMVGEQGTYWVANNFIWGWLLLPITQLAELIKQETAKDEKAVRENTLGYFFITTVTCLLWIVLIPAYKPFMRYVLDFDDVEKLFGLVMVLLGFYVLYAYQNVFDATFYGRGKTEYMLLESVVTNSIYYGLFFILFMTGVWTPTLIGIALMFGGGNAFDSVVSYLVYRYYRKKIMKRQIRKKSNKLSWTFLVIGILIITIDIVFLFNNHSSELDGWKKNIMNISPFILFWGTVIVAASIWLIVTTNSLNNLLKKSRFPYSFDYVMENAIYKAVGSSKSRIKCDGVEITPLENYVEWKKHIIDKYRREDCIIQRDYENFYRFLIKRRRSAELRKQILYGILMPVELGVVAVCCGSSGLFDSPVTCTMGVVVGSCFFMWEALKEQFDNEDEINFINDFMEIMELENINIYDDKG